MGATVNVVAVIILCCYVTKPSASQVCGQRDWIATDQYSNWTFPANSGNSSYTGSWNCTWTIRAEDDSQLVHVEVTSSKDNEMAYNCEVNSITAYDGSTTSSPEIKTLCEFSSAVITSTERYLTLQLNYLFWEGSESINFTFKQSTGRQMCPDNILKSESVNVLINPQLYTSPGYPNQYPGNLDCETDFEARSKLLPYWSNDWHVELRFIDMDLAPPPCSSEFVKIYYGYNLPSKLMGTFCGNTVPVNAFVSSLEYMTIEFKTSGNFTGRGFKLMYKAVPSPPTYCFRNDLAASTYPLELTPRSYPNTYSGHEDCTWRIFACSDFNVTIEILVLDIEETSNCSGDYLQAFDGRTEETSLGKWCGVRSSELPLKVQSSKSAMSLKFKSDGFVTNKATGFKLQYYITPHPALYKPYPLENIAGFILAGIILLVAILVFWIMRRRQGYSTRSQESDTMLADRNVKT